MRNPISQSVGTDGGVRHPGDLGSGHAYDDVVSFILGEPDFDTPPHIVRRPFVR